MQRPVLIDANPLHLIQADLVPAPVIQLGGASGGMAGHRSRILQGSLVFQVGCDPRGAKRVIANQRLEPGAKAR